MKESIKNEVLKKIKESKLAPTSRWYFVSRNYFFVLLFLVSVIVGSLAFSSILFSIIVESAAPEVFSFSYLPEYFITHIPIIWIFFVLVFTVSAWFNIRRVDGAHRTDHKLVFLASILFSLLIGLLLFYTGLSGKIESEFREIEIYRNLVEKNLEKKADFLNEQGASAEYLILKREELRTLCLNKNEDNCE